jgi:hypothetical protein
MPHSKTPGGQAASDKFLKRDVQSTAPSSLHQTQHTDLTNIAHGHGVENAPGHTEQKRPGDKNAASDSYMSTVGIDNKSTNVPGEEGNIGTIVGEKPNSDINQGNMK